MALFGIGQIGCTLREIGEFHAQGCVPELNNAAKLFNERLISLVDQLNRNSKISKFTYINIYGSETTDFKSLGNHFYMNVNNIQFFELDFDNN